MKDLQEVLALQETKRCSSNLILTCIKHTLSLVDYETENVYVWFCRYENQRNDFSSVSNINRNYEERRDILERLSVANSIEQLLKAIVEIWSILEWGVSACVNNNFKNPCSVVVSSNPSQKDCLLQPNYKPVNPN